VSNPPNPPQPGPGWEPQRPGYGAARPPEGYPPQGFPQPQNYPGAQGSPYQGYPPPSQFAQPGIAWSPSGGAGRMLPALIGLAVAAVVGAVVDVITQFHFHGNGIHWQTGDVVGLLTDLVVYGVIAVGSVILAVRASRGGPLLWAAALALATAELTQGIYFPAGLAYYVSEKPKSGWTLAMPLTNLLLVVVALVALILVLGRGVRAHFLRAGERLHIT